MLSLSVLTALSLHGLAGMIISMLIILGHLPVFLSKK
jgi:hypothetical protein